MCETVKQGANNSRHKDAVVFSLHRWSPLVGQNRARHALWPAVAPIPRTRFLVKCVSSGSVGEPSTLG